MIKSGSFLGDDVINEVGNAENPLQNEGSSMMRPFTRENMFSVRTSAFILFKICCLL